MVDTSKVTAFINAFKNKFGNKVTSWSETTSNSNYPSEKLVKDSLDGKANSSHTHTKSEINDFPSTMTPSSHTHGNLTNDGKLGSTSGKPVITTTGGKITTGSFGSTGGTFAEGNHTHSNYLTSHQDISGKENTSNKSSSITTDTGSTSKYPSVKAVEDYAQPKGNYLTSHQDISGKADKSGYTANKNLVTNSSGQITTENKPTVPTKTSQLTNDSGFLTSHQDISGKADKTGYTASKNLVTNSSGAITTEDKPTIPSKTSQLTNDSGFLTSHNPIDTALSSTSTNAVQNKVINSALSGKAASSHNHDGTYLKSYTPPTASTTQAGIVQLSTSTSGTSDSKAATESAVKAAYDKGNHSHPYAASSHTHSQYGVTVEKQTTAESGYIATYVVKQNSSQVGTKINIPKDFLVKSASVNTCSTTGTPTGFTQGDKYIDFVVNTKDGSGTDEHIYLNVNDLVDAYTAGAGLELTSSNQFKHSNSITAQTSAAFKKIKYDGQGHITGTANVDAADLPTHYHSQYLSSHQDISGKVNIAQGSTNASKNVVTDSSGNITTEAKPTIPTKTSQLTNDSNFLTSHQDISGKVNVAQGSTNANKTLSTNSNGNVITEAKNNHTHTTSQISDFPSTMTPSSHTHTKSEITDFPTLATVATSGNYNDLSNKPTIPDISGKVDKAQGSTNASKNVVTDSNGNITTEAKPTIPTKTSQLTNDSNFLTSHQDISGKADKSGYTANKNLVTNSSGQITTENKPTVPTKTSQLTNDSGFLTSHQDISGKVNKAQGSSNANKTLSTDSSGNVITEAKNNHTHEYLPLTGGTMSGNIKMPSAYESTSGNTGNIPFAGHLTSESSLTSILPTLKSFFGTLRIDNNWWNVLSIRHRNGSGDGNKYGWYLKTALQSNGDLIWNNQYTNDGNWATERTILDSGNYTNYASDKNHTHTKLVSNGALPSTAISFKTYKNEGYYTCSSGNSTNINDKPYTGNYACIIENKRYDDDSIIQFVYKMPGTAIAEIYYRKWTSSGDWTAWDKIATYDDIETSIASKADSTHTHTKSEITDFPTTMTPKSHASSASTYGLGTTSNYGHVKTINGLTQSSHTNGTALSAYQGKVLNDKITAITSLNANPTTTTTLLNSWTGTVTYMVRNGWCIVTFENLKRAATTSSPENVLSIGYNNDMGTNVYEFSNLDNGSTGVIVAVGATGMLRARCLEANKRVSGTIMFPVSS